MVSPDIKRIVAPTKELFGLAGSGESACSHQVPASGPGDRWCAFYQVDATSAELWVINVTKAANGQVACDGTDANCLRLTEDLWLGQPEDEGGNLIPPFFPVFNQFTGDTLIYYADSEVGDEFYVGPVYAWRPGWKKGKRISTAKGYTCFGHPRADVATCIDNVAVEANVVRFDLRAGRLQGGESADSTLPLIDKITPSHSNRVEKWHSDFTPNGDVFLYSTGRTREDKEVLYAVRTDEAGQQDKRVTLSQDATRWQISNDSQRVYYLKGFDYSNAGDHAGTLAVLDLPTGANGADLVPKVGSFQVLQDGTSADRGLAYMENYVKGRATLKVMKDRAAPGSSVQVAMGVVDFTMSPDLRFALISRESNSGTGTDDAYIAKVDGSPACALQMKKTTRRLGEPFLRSGGLVLWADNFDPRLGLGELWSAKPDGCAGAKKVLSDVAVWYPIGDRGIVAYDDSDGDFGTLKFAPLTNGSEIGAFTKIQEQVDRLTTSVVGAGEALVFSVTNTVPAGAAGIYLFNKFPWSPAAPAAGDGGASTATDGGVSTAPDGGAPAAGDGGAPDAR
jgi:hypothetical protein